MIRATAHLCACCGIRATRWALARPDRRGATRRLYLCDRCPSPAQIDQEARAISLAWSDRERAARYYDCPVDQAGYRNRWTVPEAVGVE